MSRHKRSGHVRRQSRRDRRWRRKDLLAEVERLSRLLAAEREASAALRREVAAPGSEDETVYMPKIKLEHTPSVPLIMPSGERTTVNTGAQRGARHVPSWAREG